MSMFGAAELFMRHELIQETSSPHVGWFSTKTYRNAKANLNKYEPALNARKFEPGSPDYLSIFCLSKSLRYIRKVGVSRIQDETRKLHQRLMDGLLSMNIDLLTSADKQYWSGIVFCRIPRISGSSLAERLKKRKVYVTPRIFKDFDGIRISPYFYNTVEEIDNLLQEIRRIQESVKH
jgi:selenocysteine lyase/cysteine desulfurase